MKIQAKLIQTQQQQQKIVMTPKLQQAIKVLMMSQLELKQFIEQELTQNPLLEIEEEYETGLSTEDYDPAPEWNKSEENINHEDTSVDIDWQSVFDDMRAPVINLNDQYDDPDAPEPDIAEAHSLQDYLYQQLQLAPFTDAERAIGELIIGNLNDDGELQLKLFSVPQEFETDFQNGCVSEELQRVLSVHLSASSAKSKTSKKEVKKLDFQVNSIGISPGNSDIGCESNNSWQLIDTTNKKTYTVKQEESELNLYLLTLEDIASETGCAVSDVETVLHIIQETFEPTGIAYRDLKETLSIQIRHHEMQHLKQNGATPYDNDIPLQIAKKIVEHHLEDLLNSRIAAISEVLEVERTDILQAASWIGTLSPYPGRYFSDLSVNWVKSTETIQGITPDVQIMDIDRDIQIFPMDNYIPRLRMNPHYINLMRDDGKVLDSETKKWIEKKYNDAADVLSSIAQRGRTIERVTEAIFNVQSEFLTQGPESIKPLTLKTVANMAGVHESTVSRVTSNKYVQTPLGTYPLKFFFSNQLATTHGNSVSAKQVKAALKEVIRKEDPTKPLSDQAVSAALKKRGIVVARRTVQKYREELSILPSRQRKNLEYHYK